MTVPRTVKEHKPRARLVGVIASRTDLQTAIRLRRPPDFFELRLDALHPLATASEKLIADLATPVIITARHPREGGHHRLTTTQRRGLLLQLLPRAAFVDLELRAAPHLGAVLEAAALANTSLILSVHDFRRTPSLLALRHLVQRAEEFAPAIFKVVTRTDSAADLARLLDFFDEHHQRLPLAVMGVGHLGKKARTALARRGSLLQYAHLGTAVAPGQLSLTAAQKLLSAQ